MYSNNHQLGQSLGSKILFWGCIFSLFFLNSCANTLNQQNHVNEHTAGPKTGASNIDKLLLHGESTDNLVAKGFFYLNNQNLQLAELHFATAIEQDPTLIDAYIGLGRIQILRGNYNLAVLTFSKAREINPNSVQALIGEAQALRANGKLDAAIQRVNTAMEINPGDIGVLRELALIYDKMGNETLSAPLYQEIVSKSPDQASSHNNLGLSYMIRGQYQDAILSFLHAHELDRENVRIKNNLASAYLLGGDQEKALNIFKKTVGEAAAYNNIGYLFMTQGRFEEAEFFLKTAIKLKPSYYVRAQENLEMLQELRRTAHTPAQ